MKRTNTLVLLVVLLTLASLVTVTFYTKFSAVEVMSIPIDLRVADVMGFNLDTDAIHFGKIPPGHEGIRNVTLANKKPFPLRAELYVEGNLMPWVSLSENPIIIEPKSNKSVTLIASVPLGTEHGKYNGSLVVVFRHV